MVRSLCTLSRGITLFLHRNRRAFSATALAMEKRTTVLVKSSTAPSSVASSSSSNSWVPDPVTGYYRPSDMGAQVDAAELRAIHLSSKQ